MNARRARPASTRHAALVGTDKLARRPDIRGLADYLAARDRITAALMLRESKTLSAAANQDLAALWETMVARIVEQNPAFADPYYRKLDNDPLALDQKPLAAAGMANQ